MVMIVMMCNVRNQCNDTTESQKKKTRFKSLAILRHESRTSLNAVQCK